ncbi:hypothetical protein K469DRAFT_755332 [Zopfia rhizophila CBS 207.26]|uniref:SMP-30/Gluconolactonase/LRE-like region domain-containing protein n=1 Tax=Zopfia rhizophila CBS 207.26 TaxID=1314779 RepID=A0A6A6DHL8_9PEZI|nr:hypothetical protein K469DRAFT_755332 [Zopfia rhizophila CBS 207.26]
MDPHLYPLPHDSPFRPFTQSRLYRTGLENVAVRPNGNLLVTRADVPELWDVNPFTGSGTLIHDFTSPTTNSLVGVAEYEDNVFAVAGGTINLTTVEGSPGTWGVWKVDMRKKAGAAVDLITMIPDGIFLNGMTALPPTEERKNAGNGSTVLVGDSTAGVIYAVSPSSGTYSHFYSDPTTMLPPPNTRIPLGINGIQLSQGNRANYLYYTSTTLGSFYRVSLNKSNAVDGSPVLLSSAHPSGLDDFAVTKNGIAYLTTNTGNTVVRRDADGTENTIGGDGTTETVFAGATAAQLGRTRVDRHVLYVSTAEGRVVAIGV